jgi:hypothetical protein
MALFPFPPRRLDSHPQTTGPPCQRLISGALPAAARAVRTLGATVEQSETLWAVLMVTTGAVLSADATAVIYAAVGLLG